MKSQRPGPVAQASALCVSLSIMVSTFASPILVCAQKDHSVVPVNFTLPNAAFVPTGILPQVPIAFQPITGLGDISGVQPNVFPSVISLSFPKPQDPQFEPGQQGLTSVKPLVRFLNENLTEVKAINSQPGSADLQKAQAALQAYFDLSGTKVSLSAESEGARSSAHSSGSGGTRQPPASSGGEGGNRGGYGDKLPRKVHILSTKAVLFPGTAPALLAEEPSEDGIIADVLRGADGGYVLMTSPAEENGTELQHYPVATLMRLERNRHPDTDHISRVGIWIVPVAEARIIGYEEDDQQRPMAILEYPSISLGDPAAVDRLVKELKDFLDEAAPQSSDSEAEGRSKNRSREMMHKIGDATDPTWITNMAAQHLALSRAVKQELLAMTSIQARLERLTAELQEKSLNQKIARESMEEMHHQADLILVNKQIEKLKKRRAELLGDAAGDAEDEVEALRKQVDASLMTEEAKKKAKDQLNRLAGMPPSNQEYHVVVDYVKTLLAVPWGKYDQKDEVDLRQAKKVLDAGIYSMDEVKDRILEYLATRGFAVKRGINTKKGPILCFIGPPGTAKTASGQIIAKATGRKFVRMALGGVHDEAEIRGHRRTYVGALPGSIVKNLIKAESMDPVFQMDEVDKLAKDFRGDPSSALLEVADPEQNDTFNDHYLDVDVDLSRALWIMTANKEEDIPGPLRDRMDIVYFHSYTVAEKLEIAIRHLIPRSLAELGLKLEEADLTLEAIRTIIERYTLEGGVRNLQRAITQVYRKIIKGIELGESQAPGKITDTDIPKYLGTPKYDPPAPIKNRIGVNTGLAWTSVGGDTMEINILDVPGRGKVLVTGNLKQVMNQSVENAHIWLRRFIADPSRSIKKEPKIDIGKVDLAISFPPAAVPKDGPSAGAAIATAMVSQVFDIPIREHLAMTGELTLKGEVRPIGGLKEKITAAHRAGYTVILIPKANEKNLADIPQEIRDTIEIKTVETMDDVLKYALDLSNTASRVEQK